jgi:squalene-hopene/tetraprenyl-beta-curcumene cyclase
MDLSNTRHALEALTATPWAEPVSSDVRDKAAIFLQLVQKQPGTASRQPSAAEGVTEVSPLPFDGGFYFSPVVFEANKGRVEETPTPHWRSYATATCDGILALLAAGVPRDDERVTAAVDWLKRHTDVDYPQGVPTDHPEPWGEAIRFYHYSVRAEVYRKLDFPAAERAKLAAAIIKHQRSDGSFVNTASPLMKEDDPVLCTALAVLALANCLQ